MFARQDAKEIRNLDPEYLNLDFTIEEVTWATNKAKAGKLCGYDNIANKILKSPEM